MDSNWLLRAAVFQSPEPAESPLLDDLLSAEAAAAGLASSPAPSHGVLLQTEFPGSQAPQSHRGAPMGPQTTGLAVTVRLRMAHVPTSIVHLMDSAQYPLVSLHIRNSRYSTARLRLTSGVEGYSAHTIDTIDVPAKQESELHHLPTFFRERLASVTEVCRASLHIQLDDLDGKIELSRTFSIWMLARTSALLHVPDPTTGLPADLTPYLAAWVTPSAPAVLELLRKAAANLTGNSIVSYQADAAGVLSQVNAIYEALQTVGISYINSDLCFGAMPGVLAQRIRLPRECLAQRSANCMDSTLLFASLLEAASLHPAIVLIPGHAFLAWEVTEDSDQWDYLETTLVGNHGFEKAAAQGRKLAEKYQGLAKTHPSVFRRLSLRALRSQDIWPME